MKITANFTIPEILSSDNLAEHLSEQQRIDLGIEIVRAFEADKRSRYDWERRQEDSLKLALQVMEEKSFPWPNASNVKFPLITIAALQYHARAYPVLINGTQVVKARVIGDNPKERDRAQRIERHMSYQVLEEDESWEDQTDKVLITQPIIGCAFKKTYYDANKRHNVSENILAQDLVVDYYTKSLDSASRISHVISLSKNDIYTRIVDGVFLQDDYTIDYIPPQDSLQLAQDKEQGVTEPQQDEDKPTQFIEQHLWLDLDGDGYEEPYIAVVSKETKKLARLVARFFKSGIKYTPNGQIKYIKAENYFTKYPFIPSPDGGFYDLGFGALLGPLNESINTIINQLVDAGTMANTAGGFISRGIKLRSGTTAFEPNEWKIAESTGDDLRKGIVPLPVREPSQVLFTLLSLLINYGERIGGSVDILVGQNPGQNTPAETTRTMAEQGMKIFSGIFKRTYRSMKEEFRKLYRLNQLYITEKVKIGDLVILPDDYNGDPNDIRPAADPNMTSDSQRMIQAQFVQSRANPMLGYNMREVELSLLRSWKVPEEEITRILPDPNGPNKVPPFIPPKIQEAQLKAQAKLKEVSIKAQVEMAKLMEASKLNQAKIDQLQAQALLTLQQADSDAAKVEIAAIDAQIGAAKQHQEGLLRAIEVLHKVSMSAMESDGGSSDNNTGGVQGMATE